MSKPTNLIPFTHMNTQMEGELCLRNYQGGRVAVELYFWDEDGEYMDVYSRISVNDPDVPLNDDEFIAKEYSENAGLVQQFIDAGFFEDTEKRCTLGHVDGVRILKVLPKAKP